MPKNQNRAAKAARPSAPAGGAVKGVSKPNSYNPLAAGRKVYGHGSYAPNKGPVSAQGKQGYKERDLRNQQAQTAQSADPYAFNHKRADRFSDRYSNGIRNLGRDEFIAKMQNSGNKNYEHFMRSQGWDPATGQVSWQQAKYNQQNPNAQGVYNRLGQSWDQIRDMQQNGTWDSFVENFNQRMSDSYNQRQGGFNPQQAARQALPGWVTQFSNNVNTNVNPNRQPTQQPTQQPNHGGSAEGDASGVPGQNQGNSGGQPPVGGQPGPAPVQPKPPSVPVNNNGQLDLPFDFDFAMDQLMANQDLQRGILDINRGRQDWALEYMRQKRDAGQNFEKAQRHNLNDASGRGMAFSSLYGHQTAETANAFNKFMTDLDTDNMLTNQRFSEEEAGAFKRYNEYLQLLAARNAQRLERGAGDLGFGQGEAEPTIDRPSGGGGGGGRNRGGDRKNKDNKGRNNNGGGKAKNPGKQTGGGGKGTASKRKGKK